MESRRSALLVASSRYDDSAFRQLHAPLVDVKALQGVLADSTIGGYNVRLLTDAASHQVNQAIEGFFSNANLEDVALLYFSGHGIKDDDGRLYLVTRDSQQQLLGSTAVSAQFIRDQLERCRSRRKIIILDCCYAGAFPVGATKDAGNVDVLGGLGGRGCAVITASSALEYAFENDRSAEISRIQDASAPSVFTGAMVDGLATGAADINGDGIIDIDELYDYIYRNVKRVMPRQAPSRHSDIEGTLYIAMSPRGPRPVPLPLEFKQAIRSPLVSTRRAVVEDLLAFCSHAHAGTALAVQEALEDLAEDDSNMVSSAARVAIELIERFLGKQAASSDPETAANLITEFSDRIHHGKNGNASSRPFERNEEAATQDLIMAAILEADSVRATARREADELTSTTEREAAKLRAAVDHEVAEKRAAAERNIAKLRTTADREVAQLRATVKRERDEILRASQREADELLAQARSQADEILNEAKSETERRWTAAQHAIGEVTVQRDNVTGNLIPVRVSPAGQELEFRTVMRGYDPGQVDNYIARLAKNPALPPPEFDVVMRGYDRTEVSEYLHSLGLSAK